MFSWITQGFVNVVNAITSVLDYINPFSENFILKGVLDFLGNIIDYLNPFSENFFGNKIVEGIKNAIEYLFVPNQEMINNKIESIKSKFAFVEDIKVIAVEISNIFNNSEINKSLTISVPDNSIGIKQIEIINLKWYEKYKNYGDIVISAFVYIFFFWRVYVNLPNIVNGVSSINESFIDVKNFDNKRGGKK